MVSNLPSAAPSCEALHRALGVQEHTLNAGQMERGGRGVSVSIAKGLWDPKMEGK